MPPEDSLYIDSIIRAFSLFILCMVRRLLLGTYLLLHNTMVSQTADFRSDLKLWLFGYGSTLQYGLVSILLGVLQATSCQDFSQECSAGTSM